MVKHDCYMTKRPDLSGSRTKNRFRSELLWGVEKLLNCLDKGIDSFAVVFDYLCDIELHLDDSYEFYQVKTSSAKKFGVSWACKAEKKSGVPIVARLYELNDIKSNCSIRLVIVGNKHFVKKGDNLEEPGEVIFATLHDDDKEKIKRAIKDHLPDSKPDLDIVSYLLVSMNLASPDDSVRGHLIKTYENVMGCEARKPAALYRALRGLAEEKACEEREQASYDEVIAHKAITKEEIKELFAFYADQEDSIQDFVMKWIGRQPPLQQSGLRCAYESIIQDIFRPQGSELIDAGIDLAKGLDSSLSSDDVIDYVYENIESKCGVEITDEMKKIYSVIVLYKISRGK